MGSLFSTVRTPSKEELEMALTKAQQIVDSNPVVVFRSIFTFLLSFKLLSEEKEKPQFFNFIKWILHPFIWEIGCSLLIICRAKFGWIVFIFWFYQATNTWSDSCFFFFFFIIGSKSYCGYCRRIKQLLTQVGATFKVIELDEEGKVFNFCYVILSSIISFVSS